LKKKAFSLSLEEDCVSFWSGRESILFFFLKAALDTPGHQRSTEAILDHRARFVVSELANLNLHVIPVNATCNEQKLSGESRTTEQPFLFSHPPAT
jgi:hypothetical protein